MKRYVSALIGLMTVSLARAEEPRSYKAERLPSGMKPSVNMTRNCWAVFWRMTGMKRLLTSAAEGKSACTCWFD
jgi:hypothetical protein